METADFVPKVRNTDEILKRSGIRPPRRERYVIINTAHLDTMTQPTHKDFIKLKQELDDFNEEIRRALAENRSIYSYSWKHTLFSSLRSMLVEIASTDEKILMERFLANAKKWFDDKIDKKRKAGDLEKSVSIAYTQSTRAVSDNSRVLSTATKKNNEADNSLNISAIQHEGDSIDQKSFFAEGISEIMPSQYRSNIFKDYEEGNRSMHGSVDPPYERIHHYERKVPKGILKPLSLRQKIKKADQSLNFELGRQTAILKDEDLEENSASEKGSDADEDKEDKEDKEVDEGKEDAEGEAPEREEAQENKPTEEDVKLEPKVFKPGIVTPAHRMYLNDRITHKALGPKDIHLPIETRSMHSHYLPSGAIQELSLERRWRENMNKKVIEKREAAEHRAYMQQWSYAKARLEEETVRKQDSFNLGSGFGKRAFNARAQSAIHSRPIARKETQEPKDNETSFSQSRDRTILNQSEMEDSSEKVVVYQEEKDKKVAQPKIVDLGELRKGNVSFDRSELNKTIEGDMSRIRIGRIKRFHESSLFQSRGVSSDIGEDGAYSVNRPLSLSVYDNQNRKNYTPFSKVHEKVNSHTYLEKQISVVSEIKAKLAKFRTKISMKSLENTILPARRPANDENDNNKSVLLPEPGRGLFFNPFIKTRERKKKKGKKKT